ncbi:hypothetical protein ROZALSC1DRAFT_30852, partial [Rozella allomycis CSF55]
MSDGEDILEKSEENSVINEVIKTPAKRRKLDDSEFLDLDMITPSKSKKKELSAEEQSLLRSEKIRRKRLQSQKRDEEEKQATVQRLLQKQTPKRLPAKQVDLSVRLEEDKKQTCVRYITNIEGSSLSIPEKFVNAYNASSTIAYP